MFDMIVKIPSEMFSTIALVAKRGRRREYFLLMCDLQVTQCDIVSELWKGAVKRK